METTFTRFVSALRRAEVRVSPAETLTAFDIVDRVGIADKELLRNALRLALAKSQEEKERFDETFERFFALAFRSAAKRTFLREVDRDALLEALAGDASPGLLEAVRDVLDDQRDRLALRVQEAAAEAGIHRISSLREKAGYVDRIAEALALDELDGYVAALGGEEGGALDARGEALLRYLRQYFRTEVRDYVDERYRLFVDASGRRALLDAALRSNLDQLPAAYHDEVRQVVERLAAKLAREHRRRRRRASRGALDLKKTLRSNLAYDGTLVDVRWRRQQRQRADVYVLCDVSGSVARVARFLLLFLRELTDVLPNVRAFAFSSRLGEITETLRAGASPAQAATAGAAAAAAIEEALFTWGKGNTDYARAFSDFRALCGTQLNRRATLIVLGDGRNNYYDPRADLFEAISRRCKRTFWLNPERREQWRQGDSEMRRYAPHCFKVATCNKIRDIERFADELLLATS